MPLEAIDVWHRFDERWVLEGIDLRVEDSETVGLVGPSGSGKTTLLAILGSILIPSKGEVFLHRDDAPEETGPPRLTQIGWVFQTSNALMHRSVLDNVVVGLLAVGMTRGQAEELAVGALERVGLGHRVHHIAALLSGGELQRVNVARGIARSPRFIFADEPTAHLDRENATTVIDNLVEACSAGTGVLIATHDPVVAAACDRVIELRFGRLVDQDET
ncbi:ABC transporter, ATP-binding protein [hydrothermal vent metagenome]|uniref:ABC transporter, ATP-binding protein n=1 Tax=hydrothermal vent metagenome TaxID=652676 RepID=A0A3B0S166_9ZZZZ